MKRILRNRSNESILSSTTYSARERLSSSKWQNDYTLSYTPYSGNLGDEEEGLEVMKAFKGQISIIAPYDDAEYYWATFSNGCVRIRRSGEVVDKMYYMNPDDWDMTNSEWYQAVVNQIVDELDTLNRGVESNMLHMSTKVTRSKKILANSESTDEYEDLPQAEQEYDSANTSINSTKLPAVYKMISFPKGSVGVDYGGGKFDNAVESLAEQGVTLHVYDPYNRSAEHNRGVLNALRSNGGADFAVCSNVLNVIKEPEARMNVLKNIKKITKSGKPVYVTVYEGSGTGNEGPTKSGYQLNRKTADYLEEIQQVFPDAKRKGKLIVANNSGKAYIKESISVKSSSNLDKWSPEELREQIKYEVGKFMTNQLGFEENEVEGYSRVDGYFADGRYVVEVGCEVGYEGLQELCNQLNPLVGECDPDAYFEPEQPGIIVCYLDTENAEIDACSQSDKAPIEGSYYDPPEDDDYEEITDDTTIYIDVDTIITLSEDGDYEYDNGYSFADNPDDRRGDWYSDNYGVLMTDGTGVVEYIDDLLITQLPDEPGKYHITCEAQLFFNVENIQVKRDYFWDERHGSDYDEEAYTDNAEVYFNKAGSSLEGLKIEKVG